MEEPTRGKGSPLASSALDRWKRPEDRLMLAAAELAFNLGLPTEAPGNAFLAAPERDERRARILFEAAVGGLYATVLKPAGWQVSNGKRWSWPATHLSPGVRAILPGMQTDIVLEVPPKSKVGGSARTVIDTKFTEVLSTGRFGTSTLKSPHMYQMYSYLRSQEDESDPDSLLASGLLLYPSVGDDVDESVTIQGHPIRFATVDLASEPHSIRARLLELVGVGPLVESGDN